jgi:hypothetical protein
VLRTYFGASLIARLYHGLVWPGGSGQQASSQRPKSPESTRRRPLAHNQHHRSLRRRRASTPHTRARPTTATPAALSAPARDTGFPRRILSDLRAINVRRPSVVRLGRRMREGCIPALGMGVDRRAFSTFLVRLRALGSGSGNNATPPAFPLSLSQLPLSDEHNARRRRHGGTKSTKTSSHCRPDPHQVRSSPPTQMSLHTALQYPWLEGKEGVN